MRSAGSILAFLALFVLAAEAPWAERTAYGGDAAASAPVSGPGEWVDFSLTDTGGKTVSLGQFIGQKPVLLYFWATWCPHCKESVPDINRMHREPAENGNVQILALDFMESPAKVNSFLSARKVAFPVLLDRKGTVARMYRVVGIPTYILIDRNGKVVYR
ncbi:MAG: TlpA disulfide reductase family protein, partial [Candidatus Deferrimicrobiaceae bacterium]